MEKNLGMIDRGIRNILALSVGVLYYTNIISGKTAMVLGIIGFYLAITSMVAFCPLYLLFKIRTIRNQ